MRIPLRFRYSMLGLMGIVLYVALGLAAVRFGSPLWANALFSAALAVVFGGILGAFFCLGTSRAFCGGLALGVFGYLLLVYGPWCRTEVAPHLFTSALLEWVHQELGKATSAVATPAVATPSVPQGPYTQPTPYGDPRQKLMVGVPQRGSPAATPSGRYHATEPAVAGSQDPATQPNPLMGGTGMPGGMRPMQPGGGMAMQGMMGSTQGPMIQNSTSTLPHVLRAGHSLLAVLVGLVGGAIAAGLRTQSAAEA